MDGNEKDGEEGRPMTLILVETLGDGLRISRGLLPYLSLGSAGQAKVHPKVTEVCGWCAGLA